MSDAKTPASDVDYGQVYLDEMGKHDPNAKWTEGIRGRAHGHATEAVVRRILAEQQDQHPTPAATEADEFQSIVQRSCGLSELITNLRPLFDRLRVARDKLNEQLELAAEVIMAWIRCLTGCRPPPCFQHRLSPHAPPQRKGNPMAKTLAEQRTTGFRPLKPGKIHLRCPECGRKVSNGPRADYDPPNAVLAETLCPKCCWGTKDAGVDYFDANGDALFERARKWLADN